MPRLGRVDDCAESWIDTGWSGLIEHGGWLQHRLALSVLLAAIGLALLCAASSKQCDPALTLWFL